MGFDDKVDAKFDQAKGEVKEQVGRLTNDADTEAEGKMDQAKGNLKEGIEKGKDAIRDATR